jgi:hypothetical protein
VGLLEARRFKEGRPEIEMKKGGKLGTKGNSRIYVSIEVPNGGSVVAAGAASFYFNPFIVV